MDSFAALVDDAPFGWALTDGVGTITLDRPERKNPLTFEIYAALRDTFEALPEAPAVKAMVLTGSGGNFCSGGDVHEIIGPLLDMSMPDLLAFTRLTGSVVRAMRACPQVVIAGIDGVCAGAGACLAMAADVRFGTTRSRVGFLFTKVGLAGCDMGACAMLPRIIGAGRAADLLYTGRMIDGDEALANGFFNVLTPPEEMLEQATAYAEELASGPTFAHAMTKRMLNQEWAMGLDEAIEAEAQAQAVCMQTGDFRRAYEAFVAKERPRFEGR